MSRPTVRELECFVAVAEELSFSRAAKNLHLTQPPLSRQIQTLEEKLNCRLLVRNTRSVSMTTTGKLLLEDARDLLHRLDAAADMARRADQGESSRIRLGFVGALLDESMAQVLQGFRRISPDCQIQLSDLTPAPLMEALNQGLLDGAFIGAPPRTLPRGMESFVWKREPLLIALPQAHPLAAEKSVRLSQLRHEGWVMVSSEAAPAFRRQFDELCRKANVKPRIVQESERVAAVLTMVIASQGISLLPEGVSRMVSRGAVFLPFAGRHTPSLEHTFVFRGKSVSAELKAFISLLKLSEAGIL